MKGAIFGSKAPGSTKEAGFTFDLRKALGFHRATPPFLTRLWVSPKGAGFQVEKKGPERPARSGSLPSIRAQEIDFALYTSAGRVGSTYVSGGPLVEAVKNWDIRTSASIDSTRTRATPKRLQIQTNPNHQLGFNVDFGSRPPPPPPPCFFIWGCQPHINKLGLWTPDWFPLVGLDWHKFPVGGLDWFPVWIGFKS